MDKAKFQYFNRDLSWIRFNERVLSEARSSRNLPLDRLKFLAIVSSNFDEFFMVRVASIKQEFLHGNYVSCPSGLSPSNQLSDIYSNFKRILEEQSACLWNEIFPLLAENGIRYFRHSDYGSSQLDYLGKLFRKEFTSLLSPLRLEGIGLRSASINLHLAFLLEKPGTENEAKVSIVQLPASIPRCIELPSPEGEHHCTLLDDIIIQFAGELFPGYEVRESLSFRIIRDADFPVDEEREDDFLEAMEEVLSERLASEVICLCTSNTSPQIQGIIQENLNIDDDAVFEVAPPLDISTFMSLVEVPGFDHLKKPAMRPIEPFSSKYSVWDWIQKEDRLLIHPFDSFNPVLKLIDDAASNPNVLTIKITLYRMSPNSPIISSLERAVSQGKQVIAVVELKARFDEARNIHWAERLEAAGVIVIYGIADLKIHAKMLLIVRREEQGMRRYLHVSTGNYNEHTARHYTDIGLLSCNEVLCYEANLVFNSITGYSDISETKELVMAPNSLRNKILNLIQREIDKHNREHPSCINAKLNSLSDKQIIDALYRASQAGVAINLNIRGICMLVPGVPGLSENIRVNSVLGMHLEHARVMYFHNGGNAELFISSADWMERNMDKRIEILIPIRQSNLKRELQTMLKLYLSAPSYRLNADGSYTYLSTKKTRSKTQPHSESNRGSQPLPDDMTEHVQDIMQSRTQEENNLEHQTFQVRRNRPRAG